MESVLQNAKHLQKLLEEQEITGEEKVACDRLVEIFQQRLLPPVIKRQGRGRQKKSIFDLKDKTENELATPTTTPVNISEVQSVSDKESVSRKSSRSRISHRQSDFVYDKQSEPKPKRNSLKRKEPLKDSKPVPVVIPKMLDRSVTKKNQVEKKSNINDSNISFASSVSKTVKNASNRRNYKGETALHSACTSRKYVKVKELLCAGANPNTRDNAGWTPLHEVVFSNATDVVKLLLEKGSFPDVPGPMNETPLHEAIKNGHVEIIKLLVKYGADVNLRNSKGLTPFNMADNETKLIIREEQKHRMTPKSYTIDAVLPSSERTFSINVYPHSLDNNMLMKLNLLSKHFTDLVIVDSLNKDTSLVITNDSANKICHVNYDILNAVIFGVPILSAGWITKSNESKLANWKDFEITDIGSKRNCIQLSYINTLKMLPKLFNGCHFYFHDLNAPYEINSHLTINKKMLAKLVVDGGGVVLKREPDPEGIPDNEKLIPFHAREDSVLSNCSHFIIYKAKPQLAYNMKHLKSLPVDWFIECIKNFQLMDP